MLDALQESGVGVMSYYVELKQRLKGHNAGAASDSHDAPTGPALINVLVVYILDMDVHTSDGHAHSVADGPRNLELDLPS